MTMPAGTYYVGDLCYVMSNEWSEVCNITISGNDCLEGEFEMPDGRRFATLGTAWGDGTYDSNVGTEHAVDSGTIGCIALKDIREGARSDLERLGAVIEFTSDFEVRKDGGELIFGHVIIDTDPDYNDEEDYEDDWYGDDEEDEDELY